MLSQIDIEKILFLDIETVPEVLDYSQLDEEFKSLWSDKTRYIQERDGLTPESTYQKAGIYAEFGKIICISTAIFYRSGKTLKLRVKSYFGDDEVSILTEFGEMLNKFGTQEERFLCGHNSKEFDIPFIARRKLIHGIPLPKLVDLAGKKPWEVKHLDTMELWKFGDYKHFTSLNLLAKLFKIPTPKDDISGADVARVYWEEKDLDRIKNYCEKDTVTVARLMQRFKGMPIITDDQIEYV